VGQVEAIVALGCLLGVHSLNRTLSAIDCLSCMVGGKKNSKGNIMRMITSMSVSIISIRALLFGRDIECRKINIMSSFFSPGKTAVTDFVSDVICGKDNLRSAPVIAESEFACDNEIAFFYEGNTCVA
jgi:hypothetical protein